MTDMFMTIVATVGIISVGFILKVMFDDKGKYPATPKGMLKYIVDSARETVSDSAKKISEMSERKNED